MTFFSIHASYRLLFLYFFCADLQSALGFFFLFLLVLYRVSCHFLSTMPRKTRANRDASTSSDPPFDSERFPSLKNEEKYLELNLKRKI